MIPTSGLILRHGGESEQRTKDRKEPAPAAIKEVTKEQGDKLEAHARERNESEGSEVSTRRSAKPVAVNGFVKDVLEGLTSEFFMSEQNVDLDDERSFDPDVADFLKKQMREKGCSFDEARLELIRLRMIQNNIDPDTGLPLDDKAVTPEEAVRRGTENVVVDLAQLPSRRATLTKANDEGAGKTAGVSQWDVGLIDQSFVDKINNFFGPKSG